MWYKKEPCSSPLALTPPAGTVIEKMKSISASPDALKPSNTVIKCGSTIATPERTAPSEPYSS